MFSIFKNKFLGIFAVILLTASFSLAAGTQIDISKLNSKLATLSKTALQLANSKSIDGLNIELDKSTNLTSEKPQVSGKITAHAKSSTWSEKPSKVALSIGVKTLDVQGNNAQVEGSIAGQMQTNSLSYYRFVAKSLLKTWENPSDAFEVKIKNLLEEASLAASLGDVANQFISFKNIVSVAIQDPDFLKNHSSWADVASYITKLKINVENQAGHVSKVEISLDSPDGNGSYKINNCGLTVKNSSVSVYFSMNTSFAKTDLLSYASQINNFLLNIQNDDKDTSEQIVSVGKSYIQFIDGFVTGQSIN